MTGGIPSCILAGSELTSMYVCDSVSTPSSTGQLCQEETKALVFS